MSDRTALYRHFDAAGRLFYVGISLSAVQRLAQHRERAAWFAQIARVTIEWLPSRRLALEAEARAINDERTLHNKQWPPRPADRSSWAVEHVETGCRDGNHFREVDALDALQHFSSEHAVDRFRLISAPLGSHLGATAGRPPLRDFDLRAMTVEA